MHSFLVKELLIPNVHHRRRHCVMLQIRPFWEILSLLG